MTRRRSKRKQATLNRAQPNINAPGGALMFVPPNVAQSIIGQTFYGNKAGFPVGNTPLFSPGTPLPPQPGVDPGGIPVRYPFPVAYNTFAPDRSQGDPDIPSFQQLRMLAKMYSGVTLCERGWFDMVPRMTLKIGLKPEYVAQGIEEKEFQEEISYFRRWFERPDGKHIADDGSAIGGKDIHTWLRKALREQTQIDELYIYKHRTRGGQLLGLHVIAGDTFKPLLNIWGDTPAPDDPDPWAFQQYPWGLPGMTYTTDMMLHYQESPAAESIYGQSRVERIIMEVNIALRKMKRDLAMFTKGNIPKAIAEVPESTNWTPDQIDSFEQQWNSLMAGNVERQNQMKFTMPGVKIIQLDNGQVMTELDLFLLNKATACYGMSMGDLSFTEGIHKSSSDSQQNMLYRRTIYPLAIVYAAFLTDTMNHDFPPALHGELFDASFGGFEETEDEQAKATTLTMYTNAGILGLTNAGKLAKLPEDPNAPHIGRVFMGKDGPVFLDDMASDKMREAALQAKMAGFQMAANPPTTQEQGDNEDNEDSAQSKTTAQSGAGAAQAKRNGAATKAGAGQAGKVGANTRPTQRIIDSEAIRDISLGAGDTSGSHYRRRPDSLTRNAQDSHFTGMMLAFLLDEQTAKKLAIPGGETASDLHITLAYLGDMEEQPEDDLLRPHTSPFKIRDAISSYTSEAKPLSGKVAGIGRFTTQPDEETPTPVYASVDVPGLAELRTDLVERIEAAGYFVADDHDFTSHITLAYIDADAAMPIEDVKPLPLTLDTVWLCVGDERIPFRLGGLAKQPSDENVARADYRRWRSRALDDIKAGRAFRGFTTTLIPEAVRGRISRELERCESVADVKAVFERAKNDDVVADTGQWQQGDPVILGQIAQLQRQGTHIIWNASKGACDECLRNDKHTVELGKPFPTGALMPGQHNHCECGYTIFKVSKEEYGH